MRRVLVVDDDKLVLAALQRLLRWECDVETAAGAVEALIKCVGFRPDVVLADNGMPYMSGVELLSELQARHSGCRKILLSGNEATCAGPFEVIPKPWDTEALLRLVLEG